MKTSKLIFIISLLTISGPSFSADLDIVTPAQKPAAELMRKKNSGVPSYNWSKKNQKNVPRLGVGSEAVLKATDLVAAAPVTLPAVKVFSHPAPLALVNVKSVQLVAPELKTLLKVNLEFKTPEVKDLAVANTPNTNEPTGTPVTVTALTSPEEKLLQALIYLDIHHSYALAIGLLSELLDNKVPENTRLDSEFHFARALLAAGIPGEHRAHLLHVLRTSKNKDLLKRTAIELSQNAQADDLALVPELDKKMEELDLELSNMDESHAQYSLNRARYYSEKGDLGNAMAATDEIPEKAKLAPQAKFLKAVLQYRAGHLDEAQTLLGALVDANEHSDVDSDFRSITAMTLARLQFQRGQYKPAFNSYLKVAKSNPLWMQAMVEQAWSQILSEDYEGAAGNMYTLHTDFFKNAFAPESYIARAVGYLNLCQYGDGAKVVYSLHHRYSAMKDMLEKYQAKNKDDANYYDTIRAFFKNPQLKTVDGLHRNFVYELARHPAFMSVQKNINSIEDQIDRYNNLSLELVKWERDLTQKQADAQKKIDLLFAAGGKKGEPDHNKEIDNLHQVIASLKIQYQTAKAARTSIKDQRAVALERFEKDKQVLKGQAAKVLHNRYNEMMTALNHTLDQAEVLRYEIYSGAGEHLRFQLAGGQITEKERQALKVEGEKAQKWDFIGEVWEDELGHFRSSLKNVCPTNNEAEKITQMDTGK